MTFKLVLVCLIATFFLKSSIAVPVPEYKFTPVKAFNMRITLLEITVERMLNLDDYFVEKGRTVFEKVLVDPTVTEVKSDAMKENVEKIQNLLNKFVKREKGKDIKIVEIFNEFYEIVKKFDKDQNDNLSEDEEILAISLQENGLNNIRDGVTAQLNGTVEILSKKFNEYVEGLTEKEKKDEDEALFSWFDSLKAEKDTVKQFNILRSYFREFIDSSSESSE